MPAHIGICFNMLWYMWIWLNLIEWLLFYISLLQSLVLKNHRLFSWTGKVWFFLFWLEVFDLFFFGLIFLQVIFQRLPLGDMGGNCWRPWILIYLINVSMLLIFDDLFIYFYFPCCSCSFTFCCLKGINQRFPKVVIL